MSSNNETQCYFVQLQFDSYLDDDLSGSQQKNFLQHLHACTGCAREFRYARTIHDGLLDLPLLDCAEETLAPVNDLQSGSRTVNPVATPGFFHDLLQWIRAAPAGLSYAIPVILLATIAIIVVPQLAGERQATGESETLIAGQSSAPGPTSVAYSPEEVAQALQDLNLAIDYLNKVSERTESMIGGRFLMMPLQNSLNASFERVRENMDSNIEGKEI